MKLIHTGIRMAVYNTAMIVARKIRTNAGYKCVNQESHALMRQVFNQPGDIDTTELEYLTVTLKPLLTTAKSAAIKELCDHLNGTDAPYLGTDLILKYAIKTKSASLKK